MFSGLIGDFSIKVGVKIILVFFVFEKKPEFRIRYQ